MSASNLHLRRLSRSRRNIAKAITLVFGSLPILASRAAFGRRRHKCFLRGTQIRTLNGYRPVESLSVGDLLPTHFAGKSPIRAIKRFRFERLDAEKAWPLLERPVRIQASAIADNVPHADLYVSRMHSLLIDGALTPAWNLINGETITVDDAADRDVIEYFHIKLDRHDVIDAEGALCDTMWEPAGYVSDDSREEYDGAVILGVCAPLRDFRNLGNLLKSRLRSAASPIVDLRRPLDRIRDRIEERDGEDDRTAAISR